MPDKIETIRKAIPEFEFLVANCEKHKNKPTAHRRALLMMLNFLKQIDFSEPDVRSELEVAFQIIQIKKSVSKL